MSLNLLLIPTTVGSSLLMASCKCNRRFQEAQHDWPTAIEQVSALNLCSIRSVTIQTIQYIQSGSQARAVAILL